MGIPHPTEFIDAAGEKEFELQRQLATAQIIAALVLAIALALSVYALSEFDAGNFQRLGSFGVALGVISLLVLREFYRRVEETRQLISQYELLDLMKNSTGYGAGMNFSSAYSELVTASNDKAVNSRRYFLLSAVLEGGLIVFSTLQWGYGDLFHCWFHNEGWTTCS